MRGWCHDRPSSLPVLSCCKLNQRGNKQCSSSSSEGCCWAAGREIPVNNQHLPKTFQELGVGPCVTGGCSPRGRGAGRGGRGVAVPGFGTDESFWSFHSELAGWTRRAGSPREDRLTARKILGEQLPPTQAAAVERKIRGEVGRRRRERPVPAGKWKHSREEALRGERGTGGPKAVGREGRNAAGVGQELGGTRVVGQLQKAPALGQGQQR